MLGANIAFALRHLVGVFYATFGYTCCATAPRRQTDGRADGDNVVSMMRHLSQIQHLSPTRVAEQSATPMVTSVDTRDDDVSALVANLGAVLLVKNTWFT